MIQTNKTLLAVLGIVLAVGFVAANSITSPASAQVLSCLKTQGNLKTPGQGTPCVGQGNPWIGPLGTGQNPGQHQNEKKP